MLSYKRVTGCEEPHRGLLTTAASHLDNVLQSNLVVLLICSLPSADCLLCRPARGFLCLQGQEVNSSAGRFDAFSLILFFSVFCVLKRFPQRHNTSQHLLTVMLLTSDARCWSSTENVMNPQKRLRRGPLDFLATRYLSAATVW